LNKIEMQNLEGDCEVNAIGAIHYKSDAHLNPNKLMAFLKSELIASGVLFKTNFKVIDFEMTADQITACRSIHEELKADHFILASGVWSSEVAKKLKMNIKLMAGKGYSFNFNDSGHKPSIPSILCEGKVAVTPMNGAIRFGGTMEITHSKDTNINLSRVQGIVDTVNSFYPKIALKAPAKEDIWYGYRPCTPTGLPIISNSDEISNLTISTGHAMMGLSLGPASGKLVEQLVSGTKTAINIDRFKWN
jgi:D-amino-acid dehydrogenase